ncbi:MAG: IS4 family transposase [Ferrimicrobium sp.]
MARAGQQVVRDEARLEDRISIGVLAKVFPRHIVDNVVEAAGVREQRHRLLPSWLVVYYVLALAFFMDLGGGRVMRKLAGTLAWAARGVIVPIPSDEALSRARTRLGSTPLRLLFDQIAGPLADLETPGAFWRGLRLVSLDGTTLDLQDTGANWEAFGGPSTKNADGIRLRGGFPQMRVVALAECGTRALIAAAVGGYHKGEKTLTKEVLVNFGPGMLVIADRNFPGYELWRDAVSTGADLLFRAGSSFELPIDQVLLDGSYLSRLKTPRDLRRAGAQDIVVRVIEYQLTDDSGGATETFTLISTLFDPKKAPAAELAELYHDRWSIETAIGAFKFKLKGNGVVLRSKNPDGAEQELWALLCAYYAIRDVIHAAACLTEQDPLRISFVNALDAVRSPIGDPGSFPPSPAD